MLTLTHMEIKKPDHVIRYRVNCIFKDYFLNERVTVQAQMLKGLLSSRKLKEATTLLGIRKSTKDKKMKEEVIKNVSSAIKSIKRSRDKDVSNIRRGIQMAMVPPSTRENRLITSMARALGTSRKNLHKHRKFRLQIDVNDELACWRAICRQP